MQQVTFPVVGIIGAGAMGRGIAQIAAQAGSVVKLFDTRSEAVVEAVQAISGQWSRLQEKGRMTMEALAENKSRLIGANALIPEGKVIPDYSLVVGAPGRIVRQLTEEELAKMARGTRHYVENWQCYQRELKAV